jgi:hypothetical protein
MVIPIPVLNDVASKVLSIAEGEKVIFAAFSAANPKKIFGLTPM